MREHYGELWDLWSPRDWLCITTNGFVKSNGECVMGRGCAREAALSFPKLPLELGSHIQSNGNVPSYFHQYRVISFPVKHKWWEEADLELIKESGVWLLGAAVLDPGTTFYLPRPGVGNGRRSWTEEVRPLLESLDLPDNVVVVTK